MRTHAGYVLLTTCPSDVVLQISSLGRIKLQRGAYLYVGSANLRNPIARVLRHFSKDKRIHWHIDHLTKKCDPLLALLCYDVGEDRLYDILESLDKVKPAIPGFGSTDKVLHKTHLFKLLMQESTVMNSLINVLVKICSCIEVVSISNRYCFSQALPSRL